MRTAFIIVLGCMALCGCIEETSDDAGATDVTCTILVNTDTTRTLNCDDGSSLTVPGGSDGLPSLHGTICVIQDNDNGTRTIYCQDGQTFTVPGGTDTWSPVERNPACDEPSEEVFGSQVPWGGFEHNGKSYTCNRCPGGDGLIQGTWRLIDFDTEDPGVTLSTLCADSTNCLHRETVTFDGNSFSQRLEGIDLGSPISATINGWYFCSDVAELADKPKIFVVSSVSPPDAFGFDDNLAFTSFTRLAVDSDNRLDWNYSMGVNEGAWVDAIYCRVGTIITTLSGDQVPCTDPFE